MYAINANMIVVEILCIGLSTLHPRAKIMLNKFSKDQKQIYQNVIS